MRTAGGLHFDSIQTLRGIAALAVLLMHTATATSFVSGHWSFAPAARFGTWFGHAGVDLFFVLSGAIMVLVTAGAPRSSAMGEAGRFLFKRAMRVYPLYWLTLAFSVWVLVTIGPPGALGFAGFWKPVLLLVPPDAYHPVGWTLVFEIRFYLVVALLILLFRRRMVQGFAAWTLLQALAVLLAAEGVIAGRYVAMPLMLEFSLGAGVAILFLRRKMEHPLALVAASAAALMLGAAVMGGEGPSIDRYRLFLFGVPSAGILYGLMCHEARTRTAFPKALVALGDVSFSVYLWHYPILTLLGFLWPSCGLGLACGLSYGSAVVAASLLASVASYHLFERPAVDAGNRLVRWFDGRRPTFGAPPAPGVLSKRNE